MTAEELYRTHQYIIYKLAHKYTLRGMDFDEMISIANLKFVQCAQEYQPHRASFSTLLYNRVNWALYNKLTRQKYTPNFDPSDDPEFGQPRTPLDIEIGQAQIDEAKDTDRLFRFKQSIAQMTEDAQSVVQIALQAPSELLNNFPNLNKTAIRAYLLTRWHGENVQARISNAFREIAAALKDV